MSIFTYGRKPPPLLSESPFRNSSKAPIHTLVNGVLNGVL